jgi:hypothetical protein
VALKPVIHGITILSERTSGFGGQDRAVEWQQC